MAHHKRGRPKNRRAGCLFCKFHKANGQKGTRDAVRPRDARRAVDIADEINEGRSAYLERLLIDFERDSRR